MRDKERGRNETRGYPVSYKTNKWRKRKGIILRKSDGRTRKEEWECCLFLSFFLFSFLFDFYLPCALSLFLDFFFLPFSFIHIIIITILMILFPISPLLFNSSPFSPSFFSASFSSFYHNFSFYTSFPPCLSLPHLWILFLSSSWLHIPLLNLHILLIVPTLSLLIFLFLSFTSFSSCALFSSTFPPPSSLAHSSPSASAAVITLSRAALLTTNKVKSATHHPRGLPRYAFISLLLFLSLSISFLFYYSSWLSLCLSFFFLSVCPCLSFLFFSILSNFLFTAL